MQTSANGIAALEFEEGVVLRAYRDVVGKWTIGAGITSAAGVGKIGAGMVITEKQAQQMLAQALNKNYEPSVEAAMPHAEQHEFDAGVLFHWNTGAIKRASWVQLWRARADRSAIAAKFRAWNKGGGKVLPGLVKRRDRELQILFHHVYPIAPKLRGTGSLARWALPLDRAELVRTLAEFARLGYAVGTDPGNVPASEIRRFQSDHGLTADGIIGRATLTTLQRRINARKDTASTAVVTGTGASVAVPANDPVGDLTGIPYLGEIIVVAGVLYGLWMAWHYRDAIAAKINARAPKLAAFLRSF